MPTSQNGWSANDRSVIASFTVPGSTCKLALRKGDVAVVLLNFAAWYHKSISPLDVGQLDDWGYAERNVRGSSTTLSNHASGTAMDLNSTKHPLGKSGTFTTAQARAIRTKLKEYGGVIRWGGDYVNRKDEMHFEINAGAAAVKAQADRIRGGAKPATKPAAKPAGKPNPYRTPVLGTRAYLGQGGKINADEIKFCQWVFGVPVTNLGPKGTPTDKRAFTANVKKFQGAHGLTADGAIGAKTLATMAKIRH